MTKQLSVRATRRIFTALGIVGLAIVVVDVALIVMDPTERGPWFTAVSGVSLVVMAVAVRRATRRERDRG